MPDYTKPTPDAGTIPPTPRTYDEAAQTFDQNEKRAIEANKEAARQEAAKEQAKAKGLQDERRDNIKATERYQTETAKPGPAERMAGDGLQNTPERVANVTPPDAKLTAAQQEMKTKREAARAADREVLAGRREPEKKPELPTWSPSRDGLSR